MSLEQVFLTFSLNKAAPGTSLAAVNPKGRKWSRQRSVIDPHPVKAATIRGPRVNNPEFLAGAIRAEQLAPYRRHYRAELDPVDLVGDALPGNLLAGRNCVDVHIEQCDVHVDQ